MFDLMYELVPFRDADGSLEVRSKKLSAKEVVKLIESGGRDDLYNLNLVYKRMTKKNLMAIRLKSWHSKNKDTGRLERVIKFQFEMATYDENMPKGQKQKDCVKFNLDISEFSYFCDILRADRMWELIERNERQAVESGRQYADPAFEIEKEVNGEFRRVRIYKGKTKPVCIDGYVKPANGGKEARVIVGLDINEAGMLGAIGAEALETLRLWTAFGKAEENLAIINARPEKAYDGMQQGSYSHQKGGGDYRQSQPRQQQNYPDTGYREPARAAGGYDPGYGQQQNGRYQNNAYGQRF